MASGLGIDIGLKYASAKLNDLHAGMQVDPTENTRTEHILPCSLA